MTSLSYAYTFIQSNFLEIPIYYFVYWFFIGKNYSLWKVTKITTMANIITHPIVFFAIMPLKIPFLYTILIAETFAVVTETFLHAQALEQSPAKTFVANLLANLFSWQMAPVLTYLFFY